MPVDNWNYFDCSQQIYLITMVAKTNTPQRTVSDTEKIIKGNGTIRSLY